MYTTQDVKLSEDQKEKINVLNRPEDLALDFFEDDLLPMPPLGDEKVKLELEETIAKRVKLKILTQNNFLTRFPILLAQIKARSSSYIVKYEIRQIRYLLYQYNKITKKIYNNLIKTL